MATDKPTSSYPAIWRLATVLLVFGLAWDALDPALRPPHGFVLASYVLLGFVCAAAFSERVWIGILLAMMAAVGLEMLQSVVPSRDVRLLDLFAKWGCVMGGSVLALVIAWAKRPTGAIPIGRDKD